MTRNCPPNCGPNPLPTRPPGVRRQLPCCARRTKVGARPLVRCVTALLAVLALLLPAMARAQSCSSDGQHVPQALLERFISAECERCWADPNTVIPADTDMALDWIVPSPKGDDAALSTAASADAPLRLQALGRSATPNTANRAAAGLAPTATPTPTQASSLRRALAPQPLRLRVAHGVAVGGYMGASIALMPTPGVAPPRQPLTVWLLMVEEIPAGTEGTPVTRYLVRNTLTASWNGFYLLPSGERVANPTTLFESRPMRVPPGANPARLRVVGWVEDASGHLLASAASACGG